MIQLFFMRPRKVVPGLILTGGFIYPLPDFSETFGSVGMLVFEIIVHFLVLLFGSTALYFIIKVN